MLQEALSLPSRLELIKNKRVNERRGREGSGEGNQDQKRKI